MEKRSHLGMAGHLAAMSELVYRGYNVAVPAVDLGDDVYVVEDRMGTMWRLQVKTSAPLAGAVGVYQLSRRQLRELKASELYFMFMLRCQDRWRFVLIARDKLAEIRADYEQRDRTGRPGRRPAADTDARTDTLMLRLDWSADDAWGWDTSFAAYLDRWPNAFPECRDGPGAVRVADRSRDP
jgi:hypothetical protein